MAEQPWHVRTAEEVLLALGSSRQGLSSAEAARRLAEHGPNRLQEAPGPRPWQIFVAQFANFLIALLVIATVVSAVLGEWLDAIVIFAIVLASAILGFVQEYRSERALEALKKMTAPVARLLRDGEESEVPAEGLVPGDLLLLAAGDRVPADARLVESPVLKVDEAALTGESAPVTKHSGRVLPPETALGDRVNMVYTATVVTYGHARGVVTATGMQSEFGKIARMLQSVQEEPPPLAQKMDQIGKRLGVACLAISAVVVGLGLLRGHPLLEMFIWGVSLAIAAVPEALAAVVTGALAIGVQRAARRKAVIRRLPAVETLGCTTVICSDKTGTLTKNEMTVRRLYVNGAPVEITGAGYEPVGEFRSNGTSLSAGADAGLRALLLGAALCNDARLVQQNGQWRIQGDPTEGALVVAAAKANLRLEQLHPAYPRLGEVPFESERKRMTTVHRSPEGEELAFVKGAPELLLERCTHALREGAVVPLTEADRQAVLQANEAMARDALRVLGVARRPYAMPAGGELEAEAVERDLTFLGLLGMIDPPREEVREAIRACRRAGIRPVMVTGDHRLTATAVARELGLLADGGQAGDARHVLEGRDLDRLGAEELAARVEDVAVYARVSPEHKLKIVEAWQARGHVVAMTGDGVNDAPALKRADIGVAMGITGTEGSKEAADMVLLDDNFATIAAAVEEGRLIYDNIKKFLTFLLSANIGEVLLLGVAGFVGLPLPLLALQILWVNLTTDG
ncbi:MAG: HAD-IC family P-type ATPase, partial [Deltaproteobacteria bacterium]|nr:HAD-IC family P-type ATPase [Deltaproteobacteria bacterium]